MMAKAVKVEHELKMLPIDQITLAGDVRSEDNQFAASDKDDNALIDSIKAHGILNPIAVYYSSKGDTYKVVDGRRRFQAAQIAKVKQVPALVVPYTSKYDYFLKALETNVTNKSMTKSEIMNTIKALEKMDAVNAPKAIKRLGYGDSTISLYKQLDKEIGSIVGAEKMAIILDTLPIRAMREIMELPKEAKEKVVKDLANDPNLEAAGAEVKAAKKSGKNPDSAKGKGAAQKALGTAAKKAVDKAKGKSEKDNGVKVTSDNLADYLNKSLTARKLDLKKAEKDPEINKDSVRGYMAALQAVGKHFGLTVK
jgi:ParB/RepB/Spo0J family partition protein